MATTTRDGWGVSCMSGNGEHVLHVYKLRPKDGREFALHQHGDGDGRRFPSSDAAFAWALEHGYLQPYVVPWCRHCRVQHTFLRRKSGFCDVRGTFVYER